MRSRDSRALHQLVAVDAASHRAVLGYHLGAQFKHQKQANSQQKQRNGNCRQTSGLPIGSLFVVFGELRMLMIHTSLHATHGIGS